MITFSALDIDRIAHAKHLPLLVREVATIITTEEPYLELKQLVKRISDADLAYFQTASDILSVDVATMEIPVSVYQMHLISFITNIRMISTMLAVCAGEDYSNDETITKISLILTQAFDLEFKSRCGIIEYNYENLSINDLDLDLGVVQLTKDPNSTKDDK